jgi:Ca-activated chloride channel family protein
VIRLKGKMSGRDFVREIPVELPEADAQHDVLATLWARTRIDDLMSKDYAGIQQNNAHADLKETITQLGLEYRLMTQFTSFVAVEEMVVTDGGQPRRIEVPIEMPEGMSHENDAIVDGVVLNTTQQRFSNLPTQRTVQGLYNVSATVAGDGSRKISGKAVKTPAPKPVRGRDRNMGGGDARSGGGGRGGGTGTSASATGQGDAPVASVSESVEITALPSLPKLSPEDEKRQQLMTKLNPALVALVDRLKNKNAKPGVDEAKFVHDGKAEIQVWLTDKSAETLAQLRQLGFEVVLDPTTSKMVIGRVPVEKLAALAELKFVRYIAPQMSGS